MPNFGVIVWKFVGDCPVESHKKPSTDIDEIDKIYYVKFQI